MMGIYSENRPEYAIIELACMSDSITIIPISSRDVDTSNDILIFEQTELETLCISSSALPKLIHMIEQD